MTKQEMAVAQGRVTATPQNPALRPGPSTHVRLHSLTGLRFVAALMVFCYHSSLQIPTLAVFGYGATGSHWARIASNAGAVGVTFFFVLSGFVLTWSARVNDTVRAFWRRRLLKIYPNYVVAWVLAMVLFAASSTPAWRAVLNLFMLQVWVPDFFTNFSVDPPSWSLGAEAFFYACFPLLLRLADRIEPSRLKYWAAGTFAAIVAAPVLAYAFLSENPKVPGNFDASPLQYWLVYILPPVRMFDFALGILVARLVLTGRWRNIGMANSALLLAATYVATSYVPYLYAQRVLCVIPMVLLIAAAAVADSRGRSSFLASRPMRWLGDISFAFYLLHFIVLTMVMKYARKLFDEQFFSLTTGIALLAVALVVTVAVAHLLYCGFERPITRRWSMRRNPSADRGGQPTPVSAKH
ncbi:acyltransferase family protein [Jatrophihabitans sp.]|uniref:acyltransferase family protein n=1 Tax=Jatrophihabitans sp. TaxID=1932789 RepID=UPI002BF054CD|nr:acyltransferase [Jatrophihabitans sp.]